MSLWVTFCPAAWLRMQFWCSTPPGTKDPQGDAALVELEFRLRDEGSVMGAECITLLNGRKVFKGNCVAQAHF